MKLEPMNKLELMARISPMMKSLLEWPLSDDRVSTLSSSIIKSGRLGQESRLLLKGDEAT